MSVTFSAVDKRKAPITKFGCTFHASIDLEVEDPDFLHLCNGIARSLLALLGFAPIPSPVKLDEPIDPDAPCPAVDYLVGERSVLECQAAIVHARAGFKSVCGRLIWEPQALYSAPVSNPDGTVELRPLRAWLGGFTAADLQNRLDRFERFTLRMAREGATHISWS